MTCIWEFVEPGDDGVTPVVIRWTEGDILGFYWDWWSGEMRRHGRGGINPARCIEDWVTVNWAAKKCNCHSMAGMEEHLWTGVPCS